MCGTCDENYSLIYQNSYPSVPSLTPFIKAVITFEMLMRGNTDSLSKEVSVHESITAVYSRCQINKPLYVSVKHDNLIN